MKFKLDTKDCGPDSSFSILPDQLKSLVEECEISFNASRTKGLKRPSSENSNRKYRRSIYFVKDLARGHVLRGDEIKRIRPGYGLHPKFFKNLIGKTLKRDVEFAEAVSWDCFE